MHKRVKSSQIFKYITEVPSSILKPEDRDSYELKEQYNRILNENILKLAKIANLKKLVRNFEKNSLGTCIKEEETEPVHSINKKIQEKEEICQEEIAQQAVLLHKKEILKISTEQLRGKLIELQNDFDKITVNYSAFTNSNFASKYTLLVSNKALEDYENHVEQARAQFTQNIEKLEKRLKTASEQNNKRQSRASSLDSELKSKRQQKQNFCKQFEQRIKEFKISSSNKNASLQSLDTYKNSFQFIRKYIQNEPSDLSDLNTQVINKIIEKFKELEYKSESLNFTYEKMSEQEAKLNCELSKLVSELSLVKSQTESKSSPALPKQPLSSLQKVYESEILIIKHYFQIAEILYGNFEKLMNFVNYDKTIEDKLKNTIVLLKSIRIGVQKRRPFNIERFLIEKIVGRHSYLETRLEIMNSMSLNKPELRSVYLSIFPADHANSEMFIEYIESSPIIKTFLDKETLLYFLTNNSSKAFSGLLQDLSLSCNLRLIDKLKSMLIESGHLLMIINKLIPEHVNKPDFCKAHESWIMKHPASFPRSIRTQSVSPYKVTEKSHKKLQENADSSLPASEKVSSQKKVPRLYNLSSTAISRQQVVKEVLENQKKETKLRTIEKKIAKNSEKTLNLPFMKKFILRSATDRSSLYQSCKLKYL